MGTNSLDILNYLDSCYCVVGRKALNSLFFLLFSSPSLFMFAQHPNVFINLHLDSIHRSGILSSSSFSLAHLSLSFPNILMFSLIWTWMAFIGVVFLSSGGEVLIFNISTSWAMLSTFEERISNLSNFSSTLLLKAFWVVIKSLSKVSSSKVEFLVLG